MQKIWSFWSILTHKFLIFQEQGCELLFIQIIGNKQLVDKMKLNLSALKTVLKKKLVDLEASVEKLKVDQEKADQIQRTVLDYIWDNMLLLNN